MHKKITCIECPMGCEITLSIASDGKQKIEGNGCKRGENYAKEEIVCPKRVLTSTVRCEDGSMLPVKTDRPIKKEKTFEVMSIINHYTCSSSVGIGEVLIKSIVDDANLVSCGNFNKE